MINNKQTKQDIKLDAYILLTFPQVHGKTMFAFADSIGRRKTKQNSEQVASSFQPEYTHAHTHTPTRVFHGSLRLRGACFFKGGTSFTSHRPRIPSPPEGTAVADSESGLKVLCLTTAAQWPIPWAPRRRGPRRSGAGVGSSVRGQAGEGQAVPGELTFSFSRAAASCPVSSSWPVVLSHAPSARTVWERAA